MATTLPSSLQSTAPPLAGQPLSRFLRCPDPELEKVHDALWDLKQALALQCVFLAGCCHRVRAAAAALTMALQLGIQLAGNYGLFNVLTATLALPLVLAPLLPLPHGDHAAASAADA